jgi:RNA polymerase sigma-70 factor (ECF subfamily)
MQQDAGTPQASLNEHLVSLFAEVQAGNKQAFDELYEAIRRKVMAYCLAVAPSEDDAKDLFSLIIVRMYESRRLFRGGNFEAWLFTIARNLVKSFYRNRARKNLVELPEDVVDDSKPQFEVEAEVQHVKAAIERLPEEYKRVIMLKYFADMGVNEIADVEEISVELVKTRLFRARNKLATYLRYLVEEGI